MTIFVLFFVEIMAMRYATFGHDHNHGDHTEESSQEDSTGSAPKDLEYQDEPSTSKEGEPRPSQCPEASFARGDDHLGHTREHEAVAHGDKSKTFNPESYAAKMTALFILEFGIIFHSVFIGLTLAVAGTEFTTLYVVLVFHQTFEGLALGSRLGSMQWPASKRWTPYLMGIGYGLSTPIAIAIGLGVRTTFDPNSQTTLIVNGVFDSLSAGILIYTGLVEVMAHEFIFSTHSEFDAPCFYPLDIDRLCSEPSAGPSCVAGLYVDDARCRAHGAARQVGCKLTFMRLQSSFVRR
jgi:zinc transporter 1/2/3